MPGRGGPVRLICTCSMWDLRVGIACWVTSARCRPNCAHEHHGSTTRCVWLNGATITIKTTASCVCIATCRDPQELHIHPPGLYCKECNKVRNARENVYEKSLPMLKADCGRLMHQSYKSRAYVLPGLHPEVGGLQI